MQDKIFIDTNILVYMANEDSPFYSKVRKIFETIAGDYELWISRQILREYTVIMTRPESLEKPITPEEVISDLEKFENIFYIADENKKVTENLKKLIRNYKLIGKRIHDANIVATMEANSISVLFTLNLDDFKNFKGISLLDLNE